MFTAKELYESLVSAWPAGAMPMFDNLPQNSLDAWEGLAAHINRPPSPVDIDAETERWAVVARDASRTDVLAVNGSPVETVIADALRPLVTEKAQLAREVARLRGEVRDLTNAREAHDMHERIKAFRDIAAALRVRAQSYADPAGIALASAALDIEQHADGMTTDDTPPLTPERAREAGRAATRGDADVDGLSAGMTWVARTLAEALIEIGEEPDARVDVLVEQVATVIRGRAMLTEAEAPHVTHEAKIETAIGMFFGHPEWYQVPQARRDRVWGALRWLVDATHGKDVTEPFGHINDAQDGSRSVPQPLTEAEARALVDEAQRAHDWADGQSAIIEEQKAENDRLRSMVLSEDEIDALIGAVRSRPPFDGDGDLLRKLRAMRTMALRGAIPPEVRPLKPGEVRVTGEADTEFGRLPILNFGPPTEHPRDHVEDEGTDIWTPNEDPSIDAAAAFLRPDEGTMLAHGTWDGDEPRIDVMTQPEPEMAVTTGVHCNVDHTTAYRPAVLGGECAECLHRPPLHEPTCTKARCDVVEHDALHSVEPWRPTVGARVRTASELHGRYRSGWTTRQPNATGVALKRTPWCEIEAWLVRHDDGSTAPYDADELRPEPAKVGTSYPTPEHTSEPDDICKPCTEALGSPSPCAITHDFGPGAYSAPKVPFAKDGAP